MFRPEHDQNRDGSEKRQDERSGRRGRTEHERRLQHRERPCNRESDNPETEICEDRTEERSALGEFVFGRTEPGMVDPDELGRFSTTPAGGRPSPEGVADRRTTCR